MATLSPITIDGSPEECAVACSRCERLSAPVNVAGCACCGADLCIDCLGPDALGACLACVEASGLRLEPRPSHRIPVFLRQTALVPRRYHLMHAIIRATLGDQHVVLEAGAGEPLVVAPIEVVHGARRELGLARAAA